MRADVRDLSRGELRTQVRDLSGRLFDLDVAPPVFGRSVGCGLYQSARRRFLQAQTGVLNVEGHKVTKTQAILRQQIFTEWDEYFL